MTDMTQDKKLDVIMAQLADLNELLAPKAVVEYSQDDLDAQHRKHVAQLYILMASLAKGPRFAIEQIKALRMMNRTSDYSVDGRSYIGLKEAKDMVLAIHNAKKVEY